MAYTVIPLQIDEHRDALRRLWRDNSYDPEANVYAAERFDWLYRDNGASDARTWLAIESGSQSVIGCGSVFRSNRSFRGQIVSAGVPAVFFVDKEHRLAGAALAIQRAVLAGGCESGIDLFVGKPNRSARAICDRVGYRPVGDLQEWARVVWGDASLAASPRADDYADEIVSAADERFDRLWHRAKQHYPMAAEKTAAFLNWRYAGFKENYRFYCLVRRDDRRLVGYVVFYAMADGGVITDLLCEDPSGAALHNLLLGFCSRMQTEGHVWVSLLHTGMPSFEDQLEQVGFRRAKRRVALLAYVNPDAETGFRNDMLDKSNWFIFGGEMDVLLSDEVWQDRSDPRGRDVLGDSVVSTS
jgi:RimJ/RimL family protein N-acetyltransferase